MRSRGPARWMVAKQGTRLEAEHLLHAANIAGDLEEDQLAGADNLRYQRSRNWPFSFAAVIVSPSPSAKVDVWWVGVDIDGLHPGLEKNENNQWLCFRRPRREQERDTPFVTNG